MKNTEPKEFKKEISAAIKAQLPKDATDEDVQSYSSLLLKKILSLPYFKGTYDYITVYKTQELNNKSNFLIGHPNVNNFKNVTNETHSSTQFFFEDVNDEFFKVEDNFSRVVFESEKESLKKSCDVIKKATDISEIKDYFENNEKDYYLFMSFFREKFLFSNSKNLVDTLRECVALDNETFKNQYKIETYGCNTSSKEFQMDSFAIRDAFFFDLGGLLRKDNKRFLDDILNPSEISGSDFSVLLFGNFKKCMNVNGLSNMKFKDENEDEDKEAKNIEIKKREKLIKKVKKNKILYDNSLLKLILETPPKERHSELYNRFLFEKQKKQFLDVTKDLINKNSLENEFEKNSKIIDKAYEKVIATFPELAVNPKEVNNFKTGYFCKKPQQEGYDLLDHLAENNTLSLYDSPSENFGAKNMKYWMIDRAFYNSEREENALYIKHNDFEIIAINHFVPTDPMYGRNDESNIGLEIMSYNEIAENFKDNQTLKDLNHDAIFSYAKNKQIIIDVSKMKKDMPEEFLQKAIEREDVFIATDGPASDGLEIYYKGVNTIRDALFNNSLFESKKAITKDESPITYKEVLDLKNVFTKTYKEKLEKFENDYSNCSFEEFQEKNGVHKLQFKEDIENTVLKVIQDELSNKQENKQTKKNKMRRS